MASRFWLAAYIMYTIIQFSLFSGLQYFSRIKYYILASQIFHFSPQNTVKSTVPRQEF